MGCATALRAAIRHGLLANYTWNLQIVPVQVSDLTKDSMYSKLAKIPSFCYNLIKRS